MQEQNSSKQTSKACMVRIQGCFVSVTFDLHNIDRLRKYIRRENHACFQSHPIQTPQNNSSGCVAKNKSN